MRNLLILIAILSACGYVAGSNLEHCYALEDRV
jgi:hypothetical protein